MTANEALVDHHDPARARSVRGWKSRPARLGILSVSKYPGPTYANRDALRPLCPAPVTRKKWDHIDPLNGTCVDDAAAATPGRERIVQVSSS